MSSSPLRDAAPVGLVLISTFWFLLGAFALVFTMTFFREGLWAWVGLLISLVFLFEGWGLIRARLWAMVIAFAFSLLFTLGSLMIGISVSQRLISEGPSDSTFLLDLLWISLPVIFLLMIVYLVKLFSQWGREQSLSQPH